MFKLAKYYLIANIYTRAKFSVLMVLASTVGMMILSLVFSDLVAMTEGNVKGVLVIIKWILLFTLLGFTIFHLRKIAQSASLSFGEDSSVAVVVDERKERMLAKTKLRSRREIILDKYREAG